MNSDELQLDMLLLGVSDMTSPCVISDDDSQSLPEGPDLRSCSKLSQCNVRHTSSGDRDEYTIAVRWRYYTVCTSVADKSSGCLIISCSLGFLQYVLYSLCQCSGQVQAAPQYAHYNANGVWCCVGEWVFRVWTECQRCLNAHDNI